MTKRTGVILLFCAGLLMTVSSQIFAQDAAQPPVSASTSVSASVPEVAKVASADIQWIWGEVVSVNAAAKTLSIKYLDYDTDEEKTMELAVTDTTKFQGDKGIEGIKPQDTVSVEYTIQGGKNYAKDLTIEQVADGDTASDQTQTAAPEKVGTGPATETNGPIAPPDQSQDLQQGKGQ
jgi:hypothetical protein